MPFQGQGSSIEASQGTSAAVFGDGRTTASNTLFYRNWICSFEKIIHLQMNELYSIVRGKAGKSVEFGLKWGINRIDGFVMGF